MVRRIPSGLALGAALSLLSAAAQAGPAGDAVARLHAALETASRTPASAAQREASLAGIVRRTYALRTIAELRLGSSWARLSEAQRARYAEAVAQAMTADHAALAGQGAVRAGGGAESPEAGGVWVRASLRVGDATRAVDYQVRAFGGDWLVVNRRVDGRDENASEGSGYQAAFARDGFDGLLRAVSRTADPDTPPATPADATATQVVARLQGALLDVMRNAAQLGFRGRYQRLERLVKETHYIPAIARLTVRQHWDGLSKDQQRQLVETFGELSVSNYAAKFDGYKGERFTQTGESTRGKSTVVQTLITKGDGSTVRLDYTLRQVKGRWRILNITADGVSDLSTKQAEYGAVMASGGFAALIAKLQEQIRRYQTGS